MARHALATTWHVPDTLRQTIWHDGTLPLSSMCSGDVAPAVFIGSRQHAATAQQISSKL